VVSSAKVGADERKLFFVLKKWYTPHTRGVGNTSRDFFLDRFFVKLKTPLPRKIYSRLLRRSAKGRDGQVAKKATPTLGVVGLQGYLLDLYI
jgi:hypothetical protein